MSSHCLFSTRGDPMSPLRWTCKSTGQLALAMTTGGHHGNKDAVADLLRGSQCEITESCPESPVNIAVHDPGRLNGMGFGDPTGDHWCAFSEGIRNEDAGSALLMFEDGTHAAYSQNFLTRKSAGRRGAVITGYLGTIAFDWVTERITVIEHHGHAVEEIEVNVTEGHAGGDRALAQMFLDVIDGRPSLAPLDHGLASVATCLSARDSSQTSTFQPVPTVADLLAHGGWADNPLARGSAVLSS